MFIQKWISDINQTSDSNLYKYLKHKFSRNYYFDNLPYYLSKHIIRYLTRNHRLPVETGRWKNKPYNERKCNICDTIGDEYHYLFVCQQFENDRLKYIDEYFRNRPSMNKFIALINSFDKEQLKKFSIFCSKIMQVFNTAQNTF